MDGITKAQKEKIDVVRNGYGRKSPDHKDAVMIVKEVAEKERRIVEIISDKESVDAGH